MSGPWTEDPSFSDPTVPGYVTPDELAARLRAHGVEITTRVVQWHCRHGQLTGVATNIGGRWLIPAADADRWALNYTPQSGGRRPSGDR